MKKNLYEKVFDRHIVRQLSSGQYQLLIGLHLIHEVTSPQAFKMLDDRGLMVKYPDKTFATVDHIIPTDSQSRPFNDPLAEEMLVSLEKNTKKHNIRLFDTDTGLQGIVHIFAPEKGLTLPGMTICCGDSHTSTHGAFGSIAFGIGTSQILNVLATQTLPMTKLKVRRIQIDSKLHVGVYAKDVILFIINRLGVNGGVGYAYEFAGEVFDQMSMDERMTICNMSIEGGARIGYINPDQTTYDYIKGREFAPEDEEWDTYLNSWQSIKSDEGAYYDDVVYYDAQDIKPFITWGINPAQSIAIDETIPLKNEVLENDLASITEALNYMDFNFGESMKGKTIDVAFVGSCTNGRFSDFELIAKILQQTDYKVASHVKALIVPGSQKIHRALIQSGYADLFKDRGFDFRQAGCSMCLAMNPDKLIGNQICASSSNRNFKGRQGSETGRTLLMSPLMVLACAITGKVSDSREVFTMEIN